MSEVKPSRTRDDTTVHNNTTLAARECRITGPGLYEVAQDKGIVIAASNVIVEIQSPVTLQYGNEQSTTYTVVCTRQGVTK